MCSTRPKGQLCRNYRATKKGESAFLGSLVSEEKEQGQEDEERVTVFADLISDKTDCHFPRRM